VVSISLDPFYLTRLHDSPDLGDDGTVALVGTDGMIPARAPVDQSTLGRSLANTPIMRLFARSPNGSPWAVLPGVLLIVVISIVLYQARLHRTRAALRQSEARHARKSHLLEVTLQNMDQGNIKMDAEQTVEVVNRRMAELYDLPEALATGPHKQPEMLKLLWEHGEFGSEDADFTAWFERFQSDGGDGVPHEHLRPYGRVLEIRSRSLPDGGAVQTFTDITARKRAQETLRTARDEGDRSALAKSEFLAMMSHEIRSPMSGLLGIIELLRDTSLAPEQRDMIDLAPGSAASLLRVVNDILDFSKMEAGRMTVNLELLEIRKLVESIVEPTMVAAATKGCSSPARLQTRRFVLPSVTAASVGRRNNSAGCSNHSATLTPRPPKCLAARVWA
jgi:signal transduction histidine kinase